MFVFCILCPFFLLALFSCMWFVMLMYWRCTKIDWAAMEETTWWPVTHPLSTRWKWRSWGLCFWNAEFCWEYSLSTADWKVQTSRRFSCSGDSACLVSKRLWRCDKNIWPMLFMLWVGCLHKHGQTCSLFQSREGDYGKGWFKIEEGLQGMQAELECSWYPVTECNGHSFGLKWLSVKFGFSIKS